MDEREWLACTDPTPMLDYLRTGRSPRKIRLLSCAFCRLNWGSLESPHSRKCIEIAEAYADGAASPPRLRAAYRLALKAAAEKSGSFVLLAIPAAAAWVAVPKFDAEQAEIVAEYCRNDMDENDYTLESDRGIPSVVSLPKKKWNELKAETRQQGLQQAKLIRDVFGNPFRPTALDLAWRTPTLTALARAAYEERELPAGTLEPDPLAVLADALEDAGCDNADILSHLRGTGPHVRGCFLLDWILNKE